MPLCMNFFHKGSKGEPVKRVGGKTNELLSNKLWRISTVVAEGVVEDCVTHNCIHALNGSKDLCR